MNAHLVALAGPAKGSRFSLPEGESKIGRGLSCQVQIDDPALSREHCLVRIADGRCQVSDLQSHNGIFLNGQKITEATIVAGDQIVAGSSAFRYETGQPAADSDSETAELSIENSAYLSSTDIPEVFASTRTVQDLRLLLRVSTLLHSFRALEDAHHLPTKESLARHTLALITGIIPAANGAVVLDCDPGAPKRIVYGESETATPPAHLLMRAANIRAVILEAPGQGRNSSRMVAPLVVRDEVAALLYFESFEGQRFDENHLQLLTAVAGMAGIAWENGALLSWLSAENERLQGELRIENGMIGDSDLLRELQKQIAKTAPTNATVLIFGESGTGKELIARALHRQSPRIDGPFAPINCAALTETLLESELFGYEKGAFTGALTQRIGKLEAAKGGTVFLDEIGEMPLPLQVKLLRVLQERELQRVGGTQTVKLDIRLVAATNRDLAQAVRAGTFRQDLFYRLNVVTLRAPPLRERPEDIIPLAEHFARRFSLQSGRRIIGISREARAYLVAYSWPGNVRELENTVERAVILGVTDMILPEDLPDSLREQRPSDVPLGYFEATVEAAKRQAVLSAFEQADYDHERAARLLGLHPNYLHRLIRNLDIRGVLKASAKNR